MLLRQFITERYAPLHQLSDRTIELYSQTVDRFSEHLGHPAAIDDLDDLVVSRFLQARCKVGKRGKALSRHSVKKDRSQLLAVWTLAAKKRLQKADGTVIEFPALPPFKTPQKAPRGYLVAEVQALLADTARMRGGVCGRPRGCYFKTLYLALWQTAGRIGEVMAVRWEDVDLERGIVRFRAETRKNQTRDVERAIGPDLAKLLAEHVGEPGAAVWAWDRNPTTIYLHLRRQCRRLGFPCRGFHGFRKAAASYYQAAGGQAHELLDHHDTGSLARKHYLDSRVVSTGPSALDLLPKLDVTGP
jgi:integrase